MSEYKKLTKSQLSLWTGQKLHPDVPLYNQVFSFEINGPIDKIAFSASFEKLVQQSDSLRTLIHELPDGPSQIVINEITYELEFKDFTEKTEKEIENWIKQRSKTIFNFSELLFDSVLISKNKNKHFWVFCIHHIIADATSFSILFNQFAQLYDNHINGNIKKIDALPEFKSYLEFESVQQNSMNNMVIQEYWRNKIKNLPQKPTFYGRPGNDSNSQSIRVPIILGKKRTQKLKELAEHAEVKSWTKDLTLFNILATALFTYLYRIGNQKKILIGAPIHNRPTKNFKRTPGMFIEVFPLSFEFSDNTTFLDALNSIKLESHDYLRYAQPGMSTPEINGSFNVVFNYIKTSFNDFSNYSMNPRWIHTGYCDPAHKLRLHVYDMKDSGNIELYLDLNTSVFKSNTLQQAPKHFLSVLDGMLEDGMQPVLLPSLISSTDIPIQKNDEVAIKTMPSIIQLIKLQLELNAEAIAISWQNDTLSYLELDVKSNQLANFLLQKGISSNDGIALHFFRSPEYIIGVLACLKLGVAFVPIPSDQPINRINYIINDANVSLVLSSKELIESISDITSKSYEIDLNLLNNYHSEFTCPTNTMNQTAYILYTSGSTGKPKGVEIPQYALLNYLSWAKNYYSQDESNTFPLFTSIGFDLTITSTFLPLITGGKIVIYKESGRGPDLSILNILEENKVNSIKLTPSHLSLLQNRNWANSNIKTMIVGGEDFKRDLACNIQNSFNSYLTIYNEYGPTEATVGCIASKFNSNDHVKSSVPIGVPIANMQALILDTNKNLVPDGVSGELYLSGTSLAKGYLNLDKETATKFQKSPIDENRRIYKTGDFVRKNSKGELEYLGRADEQVKIGGHRIELTGVEANLIKYKDIDNAAAVISENSEIVSIKEEINCSKCGLPSNYPNIDFDHNGVCHICTAYDGYKTKAQRYFKTENELKDILMSQRGKTPNYDCISLLSGGKDSTYILAQLVNMGLNVLAFTLDNGYISDQAKENIERIVTKLGVDHVYGTTQHMNDIFVDSLHRHQNVCNGCFKTIYTLSTNLALEKQIPYVITGLSRGQFFETRLTEELFWDENADIKTIDQTILEARKLYHQEDDAVKTLMDVSMLQKEETFEKVQFIDFYRYSDVSLEEMLRFLKEKVDWVRPTDTGRSTNCIINQLGIYVHKKEKGYSNYSFPYSWDVRMGHKTREETLEEINEVIDETEVKRMMKEIGYSESINKEEGKKHIIAYYTGKRKIKSSDLVKYLEKELPPYMVPSFFKYVEKLPLTRNGKVNKLALKELNATQIEMDSTFVAPEGEIELLLAKIWQEILLVKQVGIHDNFIQLGGHSLSAIRVTARINDEIELKFPLNKIFELPTIAQYSKYIEDTLTKLLEES